jgi:HrpA-like RNA helicase
MAPHYRDIWFALKDRAAEKQERDESRKERDEQRAVVDKRHKQRELLQMSRRKTVLMSKRARAMVSQAIEDDRQLVDVDADATTTTSRLLMSDSERIRRRPMTQRLRDLSFGPELIERAWQANGGADNVDVLIRWICLNVEDEHQLPLAYQPEHGAFTVEFNRPEWTSTSATAGKPKPEPSNPLVAKMHAAGFDLALCERTAAEQATPCGAVRALFRDDSARATTIDSDEAQAMLDDELAVLESMFMDDLRVERFAGGMSVCVDVEVSALGDGKLTFNAFADLASYPSSSPAYVLVYRRRPLRPVAADAGVVKQLHRALYQHAVEQCLDTSMIFSLLCHLQELDVDELRARDAEHVDDDRSEQRGGGNGGGAKAKAKRRKKYDRRRTLKELRSRKPRLIENNAAMSKRLLRDYESQRDRAGYARMLKTRRRLPVYREREQLIDVIERRDDAVPPSARKKRASLWFGNRVTVVSGETGSGKSTQVPQFLLEHALERGRGAACSIVCTQPRRISAVSLAQRVASERDERVGHSVGYQIRLETKRSKETRLMYVTTGILLRRLETSDAYLEGVSHVVVDEVHERSEDIDFLLVLLKHFVLPARPDLRVVLMSATLSVDVLLGYFPGARSVEVPGFTHPVADYYLEDVLRLVGRRASASSSSSSKRKKMSKGDKAKRVEQIRKQLSGDVDSQVDEQLVAQLAAFDEQEIDVPLIDSLVRHIDREQGDGAILVFMPGFRQITDLVKLLQRASSLWPLPLHSSLNSVEQQRVFERPPPHKRKVIVATNIAETSITIDDVVYVIDSGRANMLGFDPIKQIAKLSESWVSQASARQRRGRAGRLRHGLCYKMFTRHRANHAMAAFETPEILRVPLHQVCLRVLFMGFEPIAFLAHCLDPPKRADIEQSLRVLLDIKAIRYKSTKGSNESNGSAAAASSSSAAAANRLDSMQITPLGRHLALLPVDVHIGKMLIFGALFGCLDPMLSVAAAMAGRSPFSRPFDRRAEAARVHAERFGLAASKGKSDHMALAAAYQAWERATDADRRVDRQFCDDNFLTRGVLWEMRSTRRQYRDLLRDIGFLDTGALDEHNRYASDMRVCSAVITAAMWPNVARVDPPRQRFAAIEQGAIEKDPEARELAIRRLAGHDRCFVHPSSLLFDCGRYETGWLCFSEQVHTSRPFIRDISMIWPFAILLFGGDIAVLHSQECVTVSGWIEFTAKPRVAFLIEALRAKFDRLLALKFREPDSPVLHSSSSLLETIVMLLQTDGLG